MITFCLIFTVIGVPLIGWLYLNWRRESGCADRAAYLAECRATVIEKQDEQVRLLVARAERAEADADRLGDIVAANVTMVEEFAQTMGDGKPPNMQDEKSAVALWRAGQKLRKQSIYTSTHEQRSTPSNADGDSRS